MKRYLAAPILVLAISTASLAAKGPEINIVDDKLSVTADNVTLGRLLQLFDLATGMKSKVPADLANRNLSVQFAGLSMTEAVRKMFQGQTFDYVMVDGQGIVITGASQNVAGTESSAAPVYNSAPIVQPADQPFVQDFQTPFGAINNPQQQQPATVQTPFGPINNPRAQQQQNAPFNGAQQQNSLFPNNPAYPGQQQPQVQQPVQIVPGGQVGSPTPFGTPTQFGTPTPFGTPTQTMPNNNGLFGSTTPFGTPAQQQR